MNILVVSNGHGEDEIGASIVKALQSFSQVSQITALPIVGKGYAYQKLNIPIVGTAKVLPSGGFNQDIKQLGKDLQKGLLTVTYTQYKTIRKWGQTGDKILAVGDLVPLLFAWLSGADYGFVGTAKSDYYLRDETDWLSSTSVLIRWRKSIYFPWERWLMSHSRCQGVFPRDSLTTKTLRQWKIPVYDLGNPMMDGFKISQGINVNLSSKDLTILLLPGSRIPEAQHNWQLILEAVQGILQVCSQQSIRFLAAIAPGLDITPFQGALVSNGWIKQTSKRTDLECQDPHALAYTKTQGTLTLTQHAYRNCLQSANIAIAMAGTATEQFVGLGKPVIIFPGKGPQFTRKFAVNQTRLLGCSVKLVETPQQVGKTLIGLLNSPQELEKIAENGEKRLGKPGAAARIAYFIVNQGFVN